MNCKPGDLAVIIGGTLGNHGHIVEVISLVGYQDRWYVRTQGHIKGTFYNGKVIDCQPGEVGHIRDCHLKPINGDQMDEDEKEDNPIEEPINV